MSGLLRGAPCANITALEKLAHCCGDLKRASAGKASVTLPPPSVKHPEAALAPGGLKKLTAADASRKTKIVFNLFGLFKRTLSR
jgi:hypothetical protein